MAIVTDIDAFLRKSLHSPLPVEKEEDIVEAQVQQDVPVEKRVRSKGGYMLRAPGQLDWREGLLPPVGYELEGQGGPGSLMAQDIEGGGVPPTRGGLPSIRAGASRPAPPPRVNVPIKQKRKVPRDPAKEKLYRDAIKEWDKALEVQIRQNRLRAFVKSVARDALVIGKASVGGQGVGGLLALAREVSGSELSTPNLIRRALGKEPIPGGGYLELLTGEEPAPVEEEESPLAPQYERIPTPEELEMGEGGPIAPQYERMPTEAEFMEGFEPYVEPGPTKAGPEEYRPEDIQEAGEESGISGTFEPDTGDFDTGEPDTGDFDTGDFDTGEPGGPKDPPQGPGQTNTDIYKQHLPEELHDDPEALAMAARDAAELQYDTEHADDEPDETWDVEIDGDIWTAERFDDKIWYVSAAGEVLRERDTTDSKSPFYDPPPPSRDE